MFITKHSFIGPTFMTHSHHRHLTLLADDSCIE